jgi:hypothetical protein
MSTFIEDYLNDPTQAIIEARKRADVRFSEDMFDEDDIYRTIGSPEFRLYEAIVVSGEGEVSPHLHGFASVA